MSWDQTKQSKHAKAAEHELRMKQLAAEKEKNDMWALAEKGKCGVGWVPVRIEIRIRKLSKEKKRIRMGR